MANPENLIPCKPGEVRNPAGRPKGAKTGVRARLRALLKKQAPAKALQLLREAGFEFTEGDIAEVLATRVVTLAIKGDMQAIKEIFTQTEEPLKLTIHHGIDDDRNQIERQLEQDPAARKLLKQLYRRMAAAESPGKN